MNASLLILLVFTGGNIKFNRFSHFEDAELDIFRLYLIKGVLQAARGIQNMFKADDPGPLPPGNKFFAA